MAKQNDEGLFIGSEMTYNNRPRFTSSIIQLPYIIGQPEGIPGGTIMEILAEPSSGKSTLSLDFIAQNQHHVKKVEVKIGKRSKIINAVYLDFERSFDTEYAKRLGVATDKLLVIRKHWAEDAFDIVEKLLSEGIQLYVIDSIPMIVTQSEEDKSHTDAKKVATEALVIDRHIKRLVHLVDEASALCIILNQYRSNFSRMSPKEKKRYGPRIIWHNDKIIIELIVTKTSENQKEVKLFIEKNKLGPAKRSLDFALIEGQGIDVDNHILTLAEYHDIVTVKGAWYYYGELKAQGKQRAADTFPLEEIKEKVKVKLDEYYGNLQDVEEETTESEQ